jgi:hypothetical protein
MPVRVIDTMAALHLRFGLIIGLCSLTFVGCGLGGSDKAISPPPQNLSIPNGTQITLACQQSVGLSAAYGSETPPHLSWIQSPSAATSGTVSAAGVYHAPDNLPANVEVTITATDIDTGVSASTVLTLVNPVPEVTSVTPSNVDAGSVVSGVISGTSFEPKAILLDPEARAGDDPSFTEPDVFGRFRDAVNFGSAIIRGLNAAPRRSLHTWGAADDFANLSHEPVFYAPSVFGYYSDYFTIPQTQVLAPEMQLYTTDAIAARAAFVKNLIYLPPNVDPYISAIDWSQWDPLAADDGSSLIDLLNHLFFHGTMSPELYMLLQDNLKSMPSSDLTARAQQTIYLAVMSPEFAVER